MGRITITSRAVPQLGRTRADFTDDWTAPATYYELSGPRISGGLTVWAEAELRTDQPPVLEDCEVHMLFGHTTRHGARLDMACRRDLDQLLTVNGVAIARGQPSTYFRPAMLADPDSCGGHLSWQLPDRTRETATALLRFVALHWVRRDPEYLVHRISAVQRSLGRWQTERRDQMARLHRQILDRLDTRARLRTVADAAHQFSLAPPPGPAPATADGKAAASDD